jgi:hypothetical protein
MGVRSGKEDIVHASQRMQFTTFGKIIQLMLFREVVIINCENHTEPIHIWCGQTAVMFIITASSTTWL